MVRVISTEAITGTKTGVPDYRKWVWSSNTIHRIKLTATEAVVRIGLNMSDETTFTSWPTYARASLPQGGSAQAINIATGLPGYSTPVGYTFAIVSYWASFSGPVRMMTVLDGYNLDEWFEAGGVGHYEHDILEDYNPLDPTGLTAHTYGWWIFNQCGYNVEGYLMITGKLIAAGTPPYPDLKEVRCAGCGHLHKIPRESILGKCPNCDVETPYHPILFGADIMRILQEQRSEE